jgi:hypothetical protein
MGYCRTLKKYPVIDPDDGDRASLQNSGFWFKIDAADCLGRFCIIQSLLKFQVLYSVFLFILM